MKDSKNIVIHGTTNWVRNDRYLTDFIHCPKLVALRALFTGKLRIAYYVPVTKKDKRLILKPKKK